MPFGGGFLACSGRFVGVGGGRYVNASKCFVYGRLEAFIVLWIKCWDVAHGDEGACIVGLGGLRVVWRCSKWSRTVFECGSNGGLYRRGE